MRKEFKMDASTRKFLARRNISHNLFEQKPKPMQKSRWMKVQTTDNWLSDLGKHIASAIAKAPSNLTKMNILFSQIIPVLSLSNNFYFSTPAGGKNVLVTEKSETDTKEILTACITGNVNPNTILRTVLTLCDGSIINALNGSLLLNTTTDPSLKCIDDRFNDQCESPNIFKDTVLPIGVVLLLALIFGCCCKYYCCKSSSNSEDEQLTGHIPLSDNAERFFARENAEARRERDMACINGCFAICTIL